MNKKTKLEFFFGSGGVGKTTISSSRAIYHSRNGKKVLLLTIDPSLRLKDYFNISSYQAGSIIPINKLGPTGHGYSLDLLLFSSKSTLSKILLLPSSTRIINLLARPEGGLNEILAFIEIQRILEGGKYDILIIDTPPGHHFSDFLDSPDKIQSFFKKTYLEIFNNLSQEDTSKKKSFLKKVVSTGVNSILNYLKKVTGALFVEEFIQTIKEIQQQRELFLNSLEIKKLFTNLNRVNWYLVTSTEQNKLQEAMEILNNKKYPYLLNSTLIVNKCLSKLWPKDYNDKHNIKEKVLRFEEIILSDVKEKIRCYERFPEIIVDSQDNDFTKTLEYQLNELVKVWEKGRGNVPN